MSRRASANTLADGVTGRSKNPAQVQCLAEGDLNPRPAGVSSGPHSWTARLCGAICVGAAAQVPGYEPAKAVIVEIDGQLAIVTEAVSHDEEIAFNAGSHTELMKLHYADFERLVQPKVAAFVQR